MFRIVQFIVYSFGRLLLLGVLLLLLGLFSLYYSSFRQESSPGKERESRKEELVKSRKRYENRKLRIQLLELQLANRNKLLSPMEYWEIRKKLEVEKLKLEFEKEALRIAGEKYKAWEEAVSKKKEDLFSRLQKWFYREGWKYLLLILFLFCLSPVLWAIFLYYGVAKMVEKFPPLSIPSLPENPDRPLFHEAATSLTFHLEGKTLFLRRGDWGKKRNNVIARTRFLWKWQYPLVSFAADLWELIAFSPVPGKDAPSVSITSPYPDLYVARVDLNNSNGLVIKPCFLVGITEDVEVVTKWSFNLHNLLSGRVRQILLRGSGSVFLTGCWGLEATIPAAGSEHKIESGLLIAYGAESEYSLSATETFWHYFRKQTSLFDQKLHKGLFITQNNTNAHPWGPELSGVEKFVGIFLNGVGKILGF